MYILQKLPKGSLQLKSTIAPYQYDVYFIFWPFDIGNCASVTFMIGFYLFILWAYYVIPLNLSLLDTPDMGCWKDKISMVRTLAKNM